MNHSSDVRKGQRDQALSTTSRGVSGSAPLAARGVLHQRSPHHRTHRSSTPVRHRRRYRCAVGGESRRPRLVATARSSSVVGGGRGRGGRGAWFGATSTISRPPCPSFCSSPSCALVAGFIEASNHATAGAYFLIGTVMGVGLQFKGVEWQSTLAIVIGCAVGVSGGGSHEPGLLFGEPTHHSGALRSMLSPPMSMRSAPRRSTRTVLAHSPRSITPRT